jgi:hypothetical protein
MEAHMGYYDLGAYSRKITPTVPEAQLWFDQGLNWLYGFNHAEAIACFKKALERDRWRPPTTPCRAIRALPARYPQRETIEDQSPWDAAYADAMRHALPAGS